MLLNVEASKTLEMSATAGPLVWLLHTVYTRVLPLPALSDWQTALHTAPGKPDAIRRPKFVSAGPLYWTSDV